MSKAQLAELGADMSDPFEEGLLKEYEYWKEQIEQRRAVLVSGRLEDHHLRMGQMMALGQLDGWLWRMEQRLTGGDPNA